VAPLGSFASSDRTDMIRIALIFFKDFDKRNQPVAVEIVAKSLRSSFSFSALRVFKSMKNAVPDPRQ
jgi:hypothetical protein